MENENELLNRKAFAIYQLLLGFVIVDGTLKSEEEEIIVDYIIQNIGVLDKNEVSLNKQIEKIANDEDNFENNALAIKMTANKDEQVDILLFISQILFADNDFSQREYELFSKLMTAWGVTKEDLKR